MIGIGHEPPERVNEGGMTTKEYQDAFDYLWDVDTIKEENTISNARIDAQN
jgi:hypothetical protein